MARNPFTPTFGVIPPFMAGRESLVEELKEAFDNGLGDPNLCTIVSGARGSGKTAFISLISQEAESQGWISAKTTAAEGMLEDLLQQAVRNAREFVEEDGGRRLRGLSLGQFLSLEWENVQPEEGNWRTRMSTLLDQLASYRVGLLITVDEVNVTIDEMKQLARVYQHFVTEGRQVALLMAGLPHNISQLLRDDGISFLRRARKHTLGRIPDREISDALTATIEDAGKRISPAALAAAVEATDGFPYMMQLVGFHTWAQAVAEEIDVENAATGVELARNEMADGVLAYTYLDLSAGDKRFLAAMLNEPRDVPLARVAEKMGVGSNYASQYRKRLLEQGIISEPAKGYVRFEMPVFPEYFAERYEEDENLS